MLAGPADSHSQLKPDANTTSLVYSAALGRWQLLASVSSGVRLASVCRTDLSSAIPALCSTLNASFQVWLLLGLSCATASNVERGISEMDSALHSGGLPGDFVLCRPIIKLL